MNEKFWFFKGLLRKWSSLDTCIKFTRKMPSNCLVQLLDPKICILQKVGPEIVFGNYKTQLWVKSYVLNMCSERAFVLWISSGPFSKSPWAFWGIRWEWVCKYQIPLQMLMSSEIAQCLHSTLGHLSALRKLLHSSHLRAATSLSLPFKLKSLFSFVNRWKSSSSSSSFFVFFNGPSSVFFFICLI